MGIETFRRYKRTHLPSGSFSADLCAAYMEVFNMQKLIDLCTDEVRTSPSVGSTVQALQETDTQKEYKGLLWWCSG